MSFERILSIANKYSYFTCAPLDSLKNLFAIKLGHSGSLLLENIKSEWMDSNVRKRENHMHYFAHSNGVYNKNSFYNAYLDILSRLRKLPFGIAEFYCNSLDSENCRTSENDYLQLTSPSIMSSSIFLPPDDATRYFLYWQRQRKLWWKKNASFPGRFQLSEINVQSDDLSTVDIYAEFPWGKQTLENISISTMDTSKLSKEMIEFGAPMIISNKMNLEMAVIGLYCDAFHETQNNIEVRLNTRISPYKCIFAVHHDETSNVKELRQLAFHLYKQFKKIGISTLLIENSIVSPVENQTNDEWGIPYTIIVDNISLKLGIIRLRNRDTTLEEKVHISEIISYVLKLIECA